MTAPIAAPAVRCTAGEGPRDCTSLAAARLTAACVHEHVLTAWPCQQHVDAAAHSDMTCARCRTCSDPHICPVEVVDLTSVEDLPATPVSEGDPT